MEKNKDQEDLEELISTAYNTYTNTHGPITKTSIKSFLKSLSSQLPFRLLSVYETIQGTIFHGTIPLEFIKEILQKTHKSISQKKSIIADSSKIQQSVKQGVSSLPFHSLHIQMPTEKLEEMLRVPDLVIELEDFHLRVHLYFKTIEKALLSQDLFSAFDKLIEICKISPTPGQSSHFVQVLKDWLQRENRLNTEENSTLKVPDLSTHEFVDIANLWFLQSKPRMLRVSPFLCTSLHGYAILLICILKDYCILSDIYETSCIDNTLFAHKITSLKKRICNLIKELKAKSQKRAKINFQRLATESRNLINSLHSLSHFPKFSQETIDHYKQQKSCLTQSIKRYKKKPHSYREGNSDLAELREKVRERMPRTHPNNTIDASNDPELDLLVEYAQLIEQREVLVKQNRDISHLEIRIEQLRGKLAENWNKKPPETPGTPLLPQQSINQHEQPPAVQEYSSLLASKKQEYEKIIRNPPWETLSTHEKAILRLCAYFKAYSSHNYRLSFQGFLQFCTDFRIIEGSDYSVEIPAQDISAVYNSLANKGYLDIVEFIQAVDLLSITYCNQSPVLKELDTDKKIIQFYSTLKLPSEENENKLPNIKKNEHSDLLQLNVSRKTPEFSKRSPRLSPEICRLSPDNFRRSPELNSGIHSKMKRSRSPPFPIIGKYSPREGSSKPPIPIKYNY